MKCPACNTVNLLISERQGIELDYCPECRGVWLDRGELDKIIERSATEFSPVRQEHHKEESRHRYHEEDHDYYTDPKTGRRKRKGGPLGFLGELFD
ncbi:hypothetical protein G9409_06885 [Chlorobium sp. BLA1]|uniref:TFIIB-type zinc ribbon-containing protein n=1 Tax=Candidatus Chlorobium masyuteum TaxID=2716876 RepID=UPI001422AF29|nr:zf-TFIIB domain-containing protein [Candidatus Chlorobium masyuteum]NHQ60316.1 hypothetical protein [Candidatus Chlorobium masyuteum]